MNFFRNKRILTAKSVSILGMGFVLMFSGCARLKRVEANVDKTNQQVGELTNQVKVLQKVIDDLNVNQGGATNKMKADLTMLIKQLDEQLERLKSEMDESQYRFKQLEKKLDAIASQRLMITGVPADSGDTSGVPSAKVVSGLDLEKLYNQAREDYIAGKYQVAFKGFETVLQKDITGTYKDLALYWMGECHYKEKKYKEASEYYNRNVSEYPQGSKMCSAYFKLGLIEDELKNKKKRNEIWNTLIKKCDGSNEAYRAKELIKQ